MNAVLNAKFDKNSVQMLFNASLGEAEHVSDLLVAQSRGRQRGASCSLGVRSLGASATVIIRPVLAQVKPAPIVISKACARGILCDARHTPES
jgi:hypothetical protein